MDATDEKALGVLRRTSEMRSVQILIDRHISVADGRRRHAVSSMVLVRVCVQEANWSSRVRGNVRGFSIFQQGRTPDHHRDERLNVYTTRRLSSSFATSSNIYRQVDRPSKKLIEPSANEDLVIVRFESRQIQPIAIVWSTWGKTILVDILLRLYRRFLKRIKAETLATWCGDLRHTSFSINIRTMDEGKIRRGRRAFVETSRGRFFFYFLNILSFFFLKSRGTNGVDSSPPPHTRALEADETMTAT